MIVCILQYASRTTFKRTRNTSERAEIQPILLMSAKKHATMTTTAWPLVSTPIPMNAGFTWRYKRVFIFLCLIFQSALQFQTELRVSCVCTFDDNIKAYKMIYQVVCSHFYFRLLNSTTQEHSLGMTPTSSKMTVQMVRQLRLDLQ